MSATQYRTRAWSTSVTHYVSPGAELSALVDLPSVSHPEYEHKQLAVADFVDHAIVTGPYPPLSRAADKPSSGWWSGILGQ
jgi:hypothetical protein